MNYSNFETIDLNKLSTVNGGAPKGKAVGNLLRKGKELAGKAYQTGKKVVSKGVDLAKDYLMWEGVDKVANGDKKEQQ